MIIWLNGAFGAGKTTTAFELERRLPGSFVYDPENIGYFIRKNTPSAVHKKDFQDHPQWRQFNYEMLHMVNREYAGVIIAPMTLAKREYYDEIIGKLRDEGADVRHIILYADEQTIHKRLDNRLERSQAWAKSKARACIEAFDTVIPGEKIITDHMPVSAVAERVAQLCGLELLPDNRGGFKKGFDRMATLIRHIR